MRVVVTGVGHVGAAGAGVDALKQALAAGMPMSSVVEPFDGLHREGEAARAGRANEVDLSAWVSPRQARRMSPPSKFAVAAASMALDGAGLDPSELGEGLGVVLATSFGPSSFTEGLLDQILLQGPGAASPFLFTESVANAPAAQVALALGARGANLTLTQREAGPLLALARGAAEVARGRLRCALVLAVDEVTPLLHGVLQRFRSLASAEDGGLPRPFDRRRDGYLLSEGAAVAVVESEESARQRGARVLARVGPVVRAFDPTAPRTGWGQGGVALAASLERRLGVAGLGPGDFDRVLSGAAGTVAGDRLEAEVLRSFLGNQIPPVQAPKGIVGEHGGGFLASALLAASGEPMACPAGFEEVDETLGIEPAREVNLPSPQRLLVSSLAPGGAAVWVVLEKAN